MAGLNYLLTLLLLCLIQSCAVTGPVSEDLGKRTLGTTFDDIGVGSRAKANIKSAHPELEKAHVKVKVFNGIVLLTGQVPSEAVKQAAAEAITGLRKVRRVHNELEIAGPTSIPSRLSDTYLSTKVKMSLFADKDIKSGRIKIVTANGVVYLMGLLTRDEADTAVNKARNVYGVQKIVKVFEYIN